MPPFSVIDVEQRSAAWFQARSGRVTASNAAAILASRKDGKESASRRDYRMQLALERLLGRALEDGNGFDNADLRRGRDLEPDAFALYEATSGLLVAKTGFIAHDELPIGVSPDGVIDACIGLLELKAPRPANHYGYIQAGVVPSEYLPQLVHGQLVTGALWTDFVSYCPDMPPKGQLFIVRHQRDEKQIASYRLMLTQFIAEVDALVASMRETFAEKAVA